MNFRDKFVANWRVKALAAGVIALLGVGFWVLPFTQDCTYFSYDLPFALRTDIRPDEVLVVYMDDESRIKLHQPVQGPWDRTLHVNLLNELFAKGAKAVVFDVLFDEPWPDKAVDEQMAATIKAHGHIVLGASIHYAGGDGEPVVGKLLHAAEPLGSAAPWGVAELPLDSDGIVRRQYYDETYTNLAWQTVEVAGFATADREKPRWINYYGPSGTIPHVSYYQVLQSGTLATGLFSNKVVFVGMAPIINYQGSKSSDEVKTPYTLWTGASSPGVEIQATASLNLIRKDWMSRLPLPIELGTIVLGAVAFCFLLPALRPGIAFVTGALISLGVAATAVIIEQQLHWWFCWADISFVEAPAALVWLFVSILKTNHAQQSINEVIQAESEELQVNSPPRIPEHEMLYQFGEGSYGQVWLAKSAFGAYRAVKIVSRANFKDAAPYEREFRGIQAFEPISRSHEGFVDILQVGRREKAGYFYYIMELADDLNLGESINPTQYVPRTLAKEFKKRGRIPCGESVQIGLLLAGALAHLHRLNLIHRDIKPSNIIFIKGIPKLADIGLVTTASGASSYVGTEGFFPPEGPGSPQADIYSLGKVLYEIAMGQDRLVFPDLPTTFAEDPDREQLRALNDIIVKACRETPIRRYANVEKMQADLKRLANRFKTPRNEGA